MSKSLGNVIDPFSILQTVGVHSVRSYFLSKGPLLKDSNFEIEELIDHHNKVICDSYSKYIPALNFSSQCAFKDNWEEDLEGQDFNSSS